jgi:broad specificity phosphatase PhoE
VIDVMDGESAGQQSAPRVPRLPMPAGVTLYFIRHGETDWNRAQRYQGQTDTPLNDTGRGQAARNGRLLTELLADQHHRYDFVASPLMRTAETMQIIRRELRLPLDTFRRDDRLKEQHFGHWEGVVWGDLKRVDPVGLAARQHDTWNWTPRGGESYAMLIERVRAWVMTVQHDTIAVSHGNISRTVRGLLLGLDQKAIPKLEVPQDKVLRLRDGKAEWL